MIMPGSTPKHTFTLPFDSSLLQDLRVTYEQNGAKILAKRLKDFSLDGNVIFTRLTQQDTLKFGDNGNVKIQLKFRFTDGNVTLSKVIHRSVYECLDREEI